MLIYMIPRYYMASYLYLTMIVTYLRIIAIMKEYELTVMLINYIRTKVVIYTLSIVYQI
jgi:hypothetical protein